LTHSLEILHRDDLKEGGFAGLREHRLVVDEKIFGAQEEPKPWPGIGRFVYLADARFIPHGETHLHRHHEVDVISVMLEGRISHEGSLEHGQMLRPFSVQVQRAGAEGFAHNEVNPDDKGNRMLQIWVLPDLPGAAAAYKIYTLKRGETQRVYGGENLQSDTFSSQTLIDIALLNQGQGFQSDSPFMAYLSLGEGLANQTPVREGDLLRGEQIFFEAKSESQLIVFRTLP